MGKIKYLTPERVNEIRNVIREIYFIEDRVFKLRKLGYTVQKKTLRNVGCPVGKVHHYKKDTRYQIGCKRGYYAWCAIFNPLPWEDVHKINLETFHNVI